MTRAKRGDGEERGVLGNRIGERWRQASPGQRRWVALVGLAVGFFVYGDVVFWFEGGYGFLEGAVGAGPVSQPLTGLDSIHLAIPVVTFLVSGLGAELGDKVAGIVLPLLSAGAVYLTVTTGHPLVWVPTGLLLAGTIAWGFHQVRTEDVEEQA